MKIKDRRIVNLLIVIAIAVISLIVAWVCFGLLESSATKATQEYSLGGAIAGFIVTASLLSSMYFTIARSDNQLDKVTSSYEQQLKDMKAETDNTIEGLRKENEELQIRLLRGVPKPANFDIEVSERERIVLARPKDWKAVGGIIFHVREPQINNDFFPATFKCYQYQINPNYKHDNKSEETLQQVMNRFYDRELMGETENPEIRNYLTHETIYVGGDEGTGIQSLKIHQCEYYKDEFNDETRKWKETRITRTEYNEMYTEWTLKRDAFYTLGEEDKKKEENLLRLKLETVNVTTVITYHKALNKIFYFDFMDNHSDTSRTSEKFNQILSSVRFLS